MPNKTFNFTRRENNLEQLAFPAGTTAQVCVCVWGGGAAWARSYFLSLRLSDLTLQVQGQPAPHPRRPRQSRPLIALVSPLGRAGARPAAAQRLQQALPHHKGRPPRHRCGARAWLRGRRPPRALAWPAEDEAQGADRLPARCGIRRQEGVLAMPMPRGLFRSVCRGRGAQAQTLTVDC